MPEDGEIPERLAPAFELRRRAARVRRLLGGMNSMADYDRVRDYVSNLELRAAELDEE